MTNRQRPEPRATAPSDRQTMVPPREGIEEKGWKPQGSGGGASKPSGPPPSTPATGKAADK